MEDNFLFYYNQELAFLRSMGEEFAQKHPKIASRLKLSSQGTEDPHVARLCESFAFLSARIHRKLDTDLPEFAEALINMLYPHYLLPIPSLSIIQFCPSKTINSSYKIPQGTQIQNDLTEGSLCQFKTCYDTDIHPISLSHIEFFDRPTFNPLLPISVSSAVKASLKLTLSCLNPKIDFCKITLPFLRFFINLPSPHSYDLYELIVKDILGAAISFSEQHSFFLSKEVIQEVGFEEHEGLLPYSPQSSLSYRLLTEFFSFPQKFLFFDIKFEDQNFIKQIQTNIFNLTLYFKNSVGNLKSIITQKSLSLHCTPIVNLFTYQAEPLVIDHLKSEYPLIPDARRIEEIEVYQIISVKAATSSKNFKKCFPLYNYQIEQEEEACLYWHSKRQDRHEFSNKFQPRTDTLISFTEDSSSFSALNDQGTEVALIEMWCTNHALPTQLPQGGDHPKLSFVTQGIDAAIKSLTPFTLPYYLPRKKGFYWQLISHLTLNHFSFFQPGQAKEVLQEILQLYNFSSSKVNDQLIENLYQVETKPITARCKGHYGNAVVRGTEIILTFEKPQSEIFLFSSILEKFFTIYCALNSFTQLTVQYLNSQGNLIQWKPKIGSKALL